MRLLICCPREVRDGQDDGLWPERYLHEVFRRIAGDGHHVAWLASRPISLFRRNAPPLAEKRGGIQYGRFGPRCLFPWIVRLILRRMEKRQVKSFDVLVDCVEECPLPPTYGGFARILPVVFRLRRRKYARQLARPMIAATPEALQQLEAAGIPPGHIIRAYGGVDSASWDRVSSLVFAAIENLEAEPARVEAQELEQASTR